MLPAPLGIEENIECLGNVLKGELGLLALGTLKPVRMSLPGHQPEAITDLLPRGVARRSENAVEVLGHTYLVLILYNRPAAARTASETF